MKAVVWTRHGPPEVLEIRELPKPVPGDDEVLIRVRAANAFRGDAELRRFETHPSVWLPLRLFIGVTGPRIRFQGQELHRDRQAQGPRRAGCPELPSRVGSLGAPGHRAWSGSGGERTHAGRPVCLDAPRE